jgi:hypothetical protein
MDQQIAAVRAALAALEATIAQTEAALNTATVPQDIVALRSVLVDLKAERVRLQFQLANLEAAAVEVQPLGAPAPESAPVAGAGARRMSAARRTQVKTLEKAMKSVLADRTVAKATIALANKVMANARKLRAIGGDKDPAPIKTRRASGARPVATKSPRSRRRR